MALWFKLWRTAITTVAAVLTLLAINTITRDSFVEVALIADIIMLATWAYNAYYNNGHILKDM